MTTSNNREDSDGNSSDSDYLKVDFYEVYNTRIAEPDIPIKCNSCSLPVHSKLTDMELKCLGMKNGSLKYFCDVCIQGLKELPELKALLKKLLSEVKSLKNPQAQHTVINEVPKKYQKKVDELNKILQSKNKDINRLRDLAISDGGLVISLIRHEAWKLLLNLPSNDEQLYPLNVLKNHPEYHQVDMDVRRCLKRFPPGISYEKIGVLQKELMAVILSVLQDNPELKYYQGYHDVAVTFLIEVGQNKAYSIMKHISAYHLKEFLKPTMDETSYLLLHVFPLIKLLDPELEEFINKSGIGTIFALPWFISWFSHSLNQHTKVVRLFDYFLASPKEMILYVIAQLVSSRRDEVLNAECDMASVHVVLSNIPESLNFEMILVKATKMHRQYDLSNFKHEVDEKAQIESKLLKDQREQNAKRKKGKKLADHERPFTAFRYVPIWVVPRMRFGLLFFGFSLAAGLWAVLKTNNN